MAEKTERSRTERRAERLQHELLVAYRTVDSFLSDWVVNISRGGIFINTRKPLAVGTLVRLIISVPDTTFPFDLSGRVTRVNEFDNPANLVPGMGIEFTNVDEGKRALIAEFVARLRRQLPEPTPFKMQLAEQKKPLPS